MPFLLAASGATEAQTSMAIASTSTGSSRVPAAGASPTGFGGNEDDDAAPDAFSTTTENAVVVELAAALATGSVHSIGAAATAPLGAETNFSVSTAAASTIGAAANGTGRGAASCAVSAASGASSSNSSSSSASRSDAFCDLISAAIASSRRSLSSFFFPAALRPRALHSRCRSLKLYSTVVSWTPASTTKPRGEAGPSWLAAGFDAVVAAATGAFVFFSPSGFRALSAGGICTAEPSEPRNRFRARSSCSCKVAWSSRAILRALLM
mmetsp:Transcript_9089/g.30032  ORF Transcript_9089/g.30032 Transcript_9089/m.30032 type:complete len:267 (-) Transcript_9089:126-926(-)